MQSSIAPHESRRTVCTPRRFGFQRRANSLTLSANRERPSAMFVGQMRKQNAASRLCGRAGAAWLVAAATAAVAGCNERSARPDPDPPTPPVMHQVSVSVSGPGTVEDAANGIRCTASCEYTFADGHELNLTQRADDGAHFTVWSG